MNAAVKNINSDNPQQGNDILRKQGNFVISPATASNKNTTINKLSTEIQASQGRVKFHDLVEVVKNCILL